MRELFVNTYRARGGPSLLLLLRGLACAALLCFASAPVTAQHEGHAPQPTATPTPQQGQRAAGKKEEKKEQQEQRQQPAGETRQTTVAPAHDHHAPAKHDAAAPKSADEKGAGKNVSDENKTGGDGKGAVDHSSHGGAGGVGRTFSGSLMVMSGEEMGVRVGASESNVMPMGQMGSGTAWQPASSPTYMRHWNAGEWLVMMHGELKLGVNRQGGPRGVTKFESQNWVMPMAFRRVGRGTLALRGMFSLEPLTFSGAGSPQLFQTGEVYKGQPIRDFQHPHDLLMELSASYTMPLGERGTWYVYAALPGEPALGPVAFMHRSSSSENPTAPLAHHLQDSTHISMGVVTTGFTYRWLKLEGSVFNGREPDDKRYNLEFNPWSSRSLRVTVAPGKNWAMQYSYGFLKNPEFFEPGDTHRQTASVQYNRPFERGNLAAAFVWGRNRESHGGETFRLNGYTAEATLNFLTRNYVYTRLELVDREGEDLLTHDELHDLGFGEDAHPQFRIGAYTFGVARELWNNERWSFALGADATLYTKPELLDALYGRNPTSYKIFLRLRPARNGAGGHGTH